MSQLQRDGESAEAIIVKVRKPAPRRSIEGLSAASPELPREPGRRSKSAKSSAATEPNSSSPKDPAWVCSSAKSLRR